MEVLRELVRYLKSRHLVRIRRSGPGRPYTDGFVLGVSDELVVMAGMNDFHPDGLVVFPRASVESVESSSRDVFWQSVLEREGHVPRGGLPARLQIGDCRALMTSLQKWGRAVAVTYLDEDDDDLYLPGLIRTVDAEGFGLRFFSTSGVWDDALTRIPYDRVLRVDVDSPYVNTFERHLVPPGDED